MNEAKSARAFSIERANLRHMVNHPEALAIFRDECGLEPRHFKDPEHRRIYAAILEAAATGQPIPDFCLSALAGGEVER